MIKNTALRLVAAAALAAFAATGAMAADPKAKAKPTPKAAAPAAPVSPAAEFAHVVYQTSGTQVHNEQPQALLRAVVVLRVKLDEQNQWKAEVFRENPDQPELTKAALESVARLPAPTGLSDKALAQLHGEGVVEAWLFQTDGRFALKSVAKPQKRA